MTANKAAPDLSLAADQLRQHYKNQQELKSSADINVIAHALLADGKDRSFAHEHMVEWTKSWNNLQSVVSQRLHVEGS